MDTTYDLTQKQITKLASMLKSSDKLVNAWVEDKRLIGVFQDKDGNEYEDDINDLISIDQWVDLMNDYDVNEEYEKELADSASLDPSVDNKEFTIYLFDKECANSGDSECYVQKTLTCPENRLYTVALGIIDPENLNSLIDEETNPDTLEVVCSDIILDADWDYDDSFVFAIHNDTDNEWVCGDMSTLEDLLGDNYI